MSVLHPSVVARRAVWGRWSYSHAASSLSFSILTLFSLTAEAGNLVENGDFDDGLAGWTETVVTPSWGGAPRFEHMRSDGCLPGRANWLGINAWSSADGYVEQSIPLPCLTSLTLNLMTWGNLDPTLATISVVDERGTEHVLEAFVPPPIHAEPEPGKVVCSGNVPIAKSYDLTEYSGQTVLLRLRGSSRGISGTYADFDDVEIIADGSEVTFEVERGPALMKVAQHSGLKEVRLDPPFATTFGRTYLPFRVHARGPSGPLANCSISADVSDAEISGIAAEMSGPPYDHARLETDSEGRTRVAYLVTNGIFEMRPALAKVGLELSNGDSEAEVRWDVKNNLLELRDRYEGGIPRGAWREWLENLVTPPIDETESQMFFWFVFKDINTWPGCFVCSSYQSKVLSMLNKLRHGPDTAWIMNGLDYGPIQNNTVGMWWLHFATIVYPEGKVWSWPSEWALVLDPWPAQKPLVFEAGWWSRLFGSYRADMTTYGPNPNFPSYVPKYPLYATHDPYPESGTGAGRESATSGGCGVKTVVIAESPVAVGFTQPDSKRIGYFDGKWVSEVQDPELYSAIGIPEPGGGTAQLVFLPISEGTLTVTGTSAGTFALHIGHTLDGVGWSWTHFSDVPVELMESLDFPASESDPCHPGVRADGSVVSPDEGCPEIVVPEGPRAIGEGDCDCRATTPGFSGIAAWFLLLVVLGVRKRCGSPICSERVRRSETRGGRRALRLAEPARAWAAPGFGTQSPDSFPKRTRSSSSLRCSRSRHTK